jgi:hypothetical protein
MKEIFDNDHGRKVITYLVVARDSRFFIKDYVKRLQLGDSTETSKKDPEKRRAELFDYSRPFFKEFLNKELKSLLSNGNAGILVPPILDKLGKEANELMKKIADLLLEQMYTPPGDEEDKKKSSSGEASSQQNAAKKPHLIEDATTHYIIKKLFQVHKDVKDDSSLIS